MNSPKTTSAGVLAALAIFISDPHKGWSGFFSALGIALLGILSQDAQKDCKIMNFLDILRTLGGLIISLRAARQMAPGTDLEIDIPDFRVDVSGKHYMVEALELHRAAPADPAAPHVVTGTLDIALEILASIQMTKGELDTLNVGDDQTVDSPDIAIGYKGVRYDITALRVKRVA